ncbi:MAG: SLC13 family permease [Phycisphaeraceae bacterium]
MSSLRITRAKVQWLGMALGPLAALVVGLLLPESYEDAAGKTIAFTVAGRATVGMMVWMGTWWLTEAVEIEVTALLPLVMFPLLQIADINAAAAPYASKIIFLFMGGFMLARAMTRWGLDKRIALITLRLVGTSPNAMVAGFMIATAMLSAFVSNTATAAMMMPIALSVIGVVRAQRGLGEAQPNSDSPDHQLGPFGLNLMLGIAYAASIGGIATIIGTPPNSFLVGFLRKDIGAPYITDISFAKWLLIGVPLVIVFLPLCYFMLTRVLFPIPFKTIEGGRELINDQYRKLGPTRRGEWITFIVFSITALLWITRPLIGWRDDDGKWWPLLPMLSDEVIAMAAGLALFCIPVSAKRREFTLQWSDAVKLPWGILILFGGGLSLASAVQANHVAEFLGSQTRQFQGVSPVLIILIVTTAVIFLTELTSNIATTSALVPVVAALAPGLGIHPYALAFPAAIAASCAFMLPVATPPNAIVFGTGYVTIPQMCRAGFWLNLIGILLVMLLTLTLLGPVLGISLRV